MNMVFLIGNLSRDPELSETSAGTSVCHFGIAVNRPYVESNGERRADFFECTAWRGTAENVAKYCKKGNKVAVTGSIQIRNYEDNRNKTRMVVDVIVQDVEFLISQKREDGDTTFGNDSQRTIPAKKTQMSFLDGDIPF